MYLLLQCVGIALVTPSLTPYSCYLHPPSCSLSLALTPPSHPPSLSLTLSLKVEQELQVYQRKLKLMEDDLDSAEDRLATSQASLKETENANDELVRENKGLHRKVDELEGRTVVCICYP